jgi:hypothetical protein
MAVAGLAAVAYVVCAPSAAADPTNDDVVCRSSVEAGVEVDTCTGVPRGGDAAGSPGVQVRVVPRFCFGFGFGGCDD